MTYCCDCNTEFNIAERCQLCQHKFWVPRAQLAGARAMQEMCKNELKRLQATQRTSDATVAFLMAFNAISLIDPADAVKEVDGGNSE